jgi:DNA processing protein
MDSAAKPAVQSLLSQDEAIHWLALRMTPGLGTRKAGQLIDVYRTPTAVFRASRSELESVGLSAAVAQSVSSGTAFEDAADQQERAQQAGVTLVPITHPAYPQKLRDIFDAPALLFCLGRVELLNFLMLGVVGTRRPSTYGTAVAAKLSRDLAEAGLTISSGMARGIDTAAHKAVLEADGDTVAVFGSGIDQIYPAENRRLAEQIAAKGLLVSEFPMGAPPYPQNFPIRNRIISGMSMGILVVEGSEYSGSAITAKLAAEQDRDVFAVPGNITSKQSWGPNLLIKQGAKLVMEWNDVLGELQPEVRRRLVEQHRKRLIQKEDKLLGQERHDGGARETASNRANDASIRNEGGSAPNNLPGGNSADGNTAGQAFSGPNSGTARVVLSLLKPDSPVPLDALVESVEGSSTTEILAVLFELEMEGLIRQMPGKSYVRIWA